MNLLENQENASELELIYTDLESRLMKNIARHLRDYGKPIDSDDWLMQKLAEIGKLNKENIQIIASTVGQSQTAIQRLLEAAAEDTAKRLEPGLSYLARQGLIGAPVAYEKSKAVKQVLEALQGQATETTNLCNTTMLYKARDAYQGLAQRVADLAHDILNRNTAAAITGAESRQQVMQRAIREFNEKGIAAFVDKKGREWTPEAYVGMAMRATSGNCATQVQMARCDDCGVDLVEVDSHSGARPKCARDQGKIFDRSNRSSKYPHWNTSSYGEPDGLLGINCGHHIYPYIEGVSARRYFPMDEDELEANDKLYKEIQKQRALERDVRKQKRECMLFQELGDDEAFNEAAVKLKEKEARLTAHINSNDQLHRRRDREQVAGYDRSVSAKAVAAKKYVDKYGAVHYNEDGTVVVTDDWTNRGHVSTPRIYRENAVIDVKEKKGNYEQVNRTFYDSEGKMYRQTHAGHHATPKHHPYGENGEHAHDYEWEDGKLIRRTTRELTDAERRESGDIL